MFDAFNLIDKLVAKHSLSHDEYKALIQSQSTETASYAQKYAHTLRTAVYGHNIYIRGLIEAGNICANDCLYCGIRRSNELCERYVLSAEQVLECCRTGYKLGFRTFVIQSGEGSYTTDAICKIVKLIKSQYSDCAVTLSLGEYPTDDYIKMYRSGADRYLLRHETADTEHYKKLHPNVMSHNNRMRCLYDLKKIGFQTGCGFMVGSPYQTADTLASDLKFIESFSPEMCGIGPFIPQKDTPFYAEKPGTVSQTLYLLSLIRIIKPNILLPATTALATLDTSGYEMGILAGANVVMPNLSPAEERKKYSLYDNKLNIGTESAGQLSLLKTAMEKTGFHIVTDRGDIKR